MICVVPVCLVAVFGLSSKRECKEENQLATIDEMVNALEEMLGYPKNAEFEAGAPGFTVVNFGDDDDE